MAGAPAARSPACAPLPACRHARLPALAIAAALALSPVSARAVPSFEAVRAAWRSSEAVLLDRHGAPLQRLRLDAQGRRLDWVALEAVSPALRRALLLSEDRRFLAHAGVDWLAMGSALGDALGDGQRGAPRGASTITMQLAGLIDGHAGRGRRDPLTKLDQAAAALALERRWRKDQILEAYLNLVPWRGELVGIAALSELVFGKAPIGLDAAEAALAAALLRGPNASPPQVAQRACLLLREQSLAMLCGALEGRARTLLSAPPVTSPLEEGLAPHLARRLLRKPGERLRSTLDAATQRLARDALWRHLHELADRGATDGAVVVLDNASGEVLAWVGSSGTLSAAPQVDAVLARRQAGSTLKPFLYARAIDEGRLTAASLLEDRPADLPVGGGLYLPQNFDRQFRGWVSVRSALAGSLNLPAVRTAAMITPEAFAASLRALGLASVDRHGDHYGPSLALGSADVTLLELANAYRALARGGLADAPRTRVASAASPPGRAAPVRALGAGASHVVADILADRDARASSFGWDSPLATRGWAAVKTGTSKDMRDAWCVGFTSRYTVGVWVGNAAGEAMRQVSGTRGAAPVWAELIAHLHRDDPARPPPLPAGVVRTRVSFEPALEPTREELFLRGTEQRTVRLAPPVTRPGIAYPPDGTRIALDPDIPPASQRVLLRARDGPGARQARWWIDGREAGRGERLAWFPMPGEHRIALRDPAGILLDEVRVEVRGATLLSARRPPPGPPPR
jgi:penicillin-binding protein 1C